MGPFRDPVTPGKDPASIDRRGLVGVGELTTPRWARGERRDEIEIDEQVDEVDEDELAEVIGEEVDGHREELEEEVDVPDSPWTIEAIDGEPDEIDETKVVERKSCIQDTPSHPKTGLHYRQAQTSLP
ncbi:hypothetical protein EW026_g3243 [Hermanssonia centrifuga]|uniref:Uncharacterized protein n=1 Tax=Hermanssonia centrifuga TaxID=98765 RepID=A0A4S4KLU1_9APHY|nr:hypothetical protein EW026_g3243 [Hermanssonia centrifuga]